MAAASPSEVRQPRRRPARSNAAGGPSRRTAAGVAGSGVLLSSAGERTTPGRPGTSSLHVVTSDPDAVMTRAIKLSASIVHPLVDQTNYPSRDITVADPDGNHWTFATFAG